MSSVNFLIDRRIFTCARIQMSPPRDEDEPFCSSSENRLMIDYSACHNTSDRHIRLQSLFLLIRFFLFHLQLFNGRSSCVVARFDFVIGLRPVSDRLRRDEKSSPPRPCSNTPISLTIHSIPLSLSLCVSVSFSSVTRTQSETESRTLIHRKKNKTRRRKNRIRVELWQLCSFPNHLPLTQHRPTFLRFLRQG